MISPLAVILVLLWGAIAGLDLVSVPQGLLSRPLVAATVAGLICGNAAGGRQSGTGQMPGRGMGVGGTPHR